MSHVASKILADNDMPSRPMSSVKLLFDLRRDVLLDVVFFERGRRDIDTLLLHLFAHVYVFNDGFRTTAGVAAISWAGTRVGGRRSERVKLVCHAIW